MISNQVLYLFWPSKHTFFLPIAPQWVPRSDQWTINPILVKCMSNWHLPTVFPIFVAWFLLRNTSRVGLNNIIIIVQKFGSMKTISIIMSKGPFYGTHLFLWTHLGVIGRKKKVCLKGENSFKTLFWTKIALFTVL